jgi:hypothetical protein
VKFDTPTGRVLVWGHRGVDEEDRWHPISGIGISEIPAAKNSCISKSRTAKSRKAEGVSVEASCQHSRGGGQCHREGASCQCSESRDLDDRESRRRMHFGIANPETTTRGKVVVTG